MPDRPVTPEQRQKDRIASLSAAASGGTSPRRPKGGNGSAFSDAQTTTRRPGMLFRARRAVISEFECPDCHARQPEPGRCGRCPGTTRPVTPDDRRKRQAAEARVRQLEEALTTIADAHPSGTLAAVSLLAREVLAAKENTTP